MTETRDGIFAEEDILTEYNLNKYDVQPTKIDWEKNIATKRYADLKALAKTKYKIGNGAESSQEKMAVKIACSGYILNTFIDLKQELEDEKNDFLDKKQVKALINSNNEIIDDFTTNVNNITEKYIKRAEEIQKSWFEDWKNFGDFEYYTPLTSQMRSLNNKARKQLLEETKNRYQNLLQYNDTDENDNPMKWWIKTKVIPQINKYMKKEPKEWGTALNADDYTDAIVGQKLESFTDEIKQLPENNLREAYFQIEKVLDYIRRFALIDTSISNSVPITMYDRINSIQIIDGYNIHPDTVQNGLLTFYTFMSNKYNSNALKDFITYMQSSNSDRERFSDSIPLEYWQAEHGNYFNSFTKVVDILFEIYFIRLNGNNNNKNFNIASIANNYRRYKDGYGIFYYPPDVEVSAMSDLGRTIMSSMPFVNSFRRINQAPERIVDSAQTAWENGVKRPVNDYVVRPYNYVRGNGNNQNKPKMENMTFIPQKPKKN